MSFMNDLMKKTTNATSVAKLNLSKHAPTIGVAGGVIGIGATAYLASRGTLKAQEVMADHRKLVNDLEEARKLREENPDKVDYSNEDYARDNAIVWSRTLFKLMRVYAPAIAVGCASATLIIASHKAMTNRVAAVSAAYTVLQKSFDEYRERIEDRLEESDEDKEKSNQEKREDLIKKKKDGTLNTSTYDRLFGEGHSVCWTRDMRSNYQFLSAKQNYFNDMLVAKGYVFLNDVYEGLGFERTPAGQMVGWLRSDLQNKETDNVGDGYIDFGIFNTEDISERMANVEDYDAGNIDVILEFNVDHKPIYDQI